MQDIETKVGLQGLLAAQKEGKPFDGDSWKRCYLRPGQRVLTSSDCGHKIDLSSKPKTNCRQCWGLWFTSNTEFTQVIIGILNHPDAEQHKPAIVAAHGKKFLKFAEEFLAFARAAVSTAAEQAA
jgi:hypothetical protein